MRIQIKLALDLQENIDNEAGNYNEAFKKVKRVFSEKNPSPVALFQISTSLGRLQRIGESLDWNEGVLKSWIRLVGNDHEQTMTARHNNAWLLGEVGRLDEALLLYQTRRC